MENNKPRICYIVNSLNPGGTERLVIKMAKAFTSDYDVDVICLDEPGKWVDELRGVGINATCLWRQPGLDLGIAKKIAGHCRKSKVDIIHAHHCTPWFYASLSRLLYRKPKIIFQENGRFFPEKISRKRVLANRIIINPLTHRSVAVSEDIRNRLSRFEGIPAKRTEIIYNGVDANVKCMSVEEKTALRREFGISPDDFVVGSLGRIDAIKNLPLLLKGLSGARDKFPMVKGLLIGAGPQSDELKILRDQLSLQETVVMTGYRDNADQLMQCMDLFVLCSFSEGISMSLLEAMASGIPTLVTEVGGNPDVVLDGRTGWVVPSDDVEAITAAIIEAAFNSQKCRQFGEAGKHRFETYFTFNTMIDSYRKIYKELTESGKEAGIGSGKPAEE